MKRTPFLVMMVLLVPGAAAAQGNSCWGEATAIFAQMGEMGQHASEQDEPRIGLANLAIALFEDGTIADPSLGTLAEYLDSVLGLGIERCLDDPGEVAEVEATAAANAACWGQASAVFAQMGMMGQHAAEQDEPRMGLRNLARYLFEQGVIADDTLEALGAWVSTELGLDVDACM